MSDLQSTAATRERTWVAIAGVLGLTGVALGAFGAHGLRSMLAGLPDETQRLGWWQTAAHYHLVHALAVGLSAWRVGRDPHDRWARGSGPAFTLGVVVFGGTLYAMALGAPRWLGAITPIGGVAMMAGWALIIASALRRSPGPRG